MIQGWLPWAYYSHPHDPFCGNNRLIRELDEDDRVCFDCPLPECDQLDARCPFCERNQRNADYQMVWKMLNRELRKAERAAKEGG